MENSDAQHAALLDRIDQLEARLARLEATTQAHGIGIPWDVIFAAVAAVIPGDYRLVDVELARPPWMPDTWALTGRMGLHRSHTLP